MKLIIITLLFFTISLSGCDAPVTVSERTDQLRYDYEALQVEHETLLLNYGILEKAKDELSILRDEHNKLINEYANLQTKYAILESYYNDISNQYKDLLLQLSSRHIDSNALIRELSEQYSELERTQIELTKQIDAVRSKNVPLLSANLTDIEYNAFYKGWDLWWWTFHEKDEEE